ncbi:MAG: hypothetical protein GX811_12910, partial [Lentisphaerae bacterium]|nr:hypothetical protein [Lentisphaerota bacterium]
LADRPSVSMWVGALPFAATWFGAMIFLFLCFSVTNVIFGNLLQATRGIISVVLGAALAFIGLRELESKVSALVFTKRVIAAILMTLSIIMFHVGAGR